MNRSLALFALSALLSGCSHQSQSPDSRSYDILVKNQTTEPVTLVLRKDSGPAEDAWITPEQLAGGSKVGDARWGLGVVQPGRAVAARNVKGEFAPGSKAWLRVYRGQPSVGEMLRIGPNSPDRAEAALAPGENRLLVRLSGDRLEISTGPTGK